MTIGMGEGMRFDRKPCQSQSKRKIENKTLHEKLNDEKILYDSRRRIYRRIIKRMKDSSGCTCHQQIVRTYVKNYPIAYRISIRQPDYVSQRKLKHSKECKEGEAVDVKEGV